MLDRTKMGEFRAFVQTQIEQMQDIVASLDAMGITAPARRGRPRSAQNNHTTTQTVARKASWTKARRLAQSRRAKLMWAKRSKNRKAMGAAA